ncbi:probable E3 SUMO-protein ligase RNF212 isoform X3 [Rhineura floridana]|uniref:probable E3 SUMO-protein ligase RNF212 isoform X3 n=1 Tax=Rhineura floridana TaxID=261503 RepID=UPI002AC82561|nr:probable E3 SUMO-protein ligase RNF212 isoform X3 [Rhineura floridana]
MAALVFCNACFQKPQRATQKFCLTNCGHVICEQCLQKGKKDECVICRAPCRTIVLSKKVNSDIQSLFTGIDGLCRKYSKEVTQIAQFQEKHRRQLLAHYRGKITKLEGYLKKATQQMQHIQQRVSSMEVDHVPSLMRKTETVAGPTRISLISPPQKGHMDTVLSIECLGHHPSECPVGRLLICHHLYHHKIVEITYQMVLDKELLSIIDVYQHLHSRQ